MAKHDLKHDEPLYSEDGTDLTLIRWMLSLTPEERLNVLQNNIASIRRLKNAGIRTQNNGASERTP